MIFERHGIKFESEDSGDGQTKSLVATIGNCRFAIGSKEFYGKKFFHHNIGLLECHNAHVSTLCGYYDSKERVVDNALEYAIMLHKALGDLLEHFDKAKQWK